MATAAFRVEDAFGNRISLTNKAKLLEMKENLEIAVTNPEQAPVPAIIDFTSHLS